MEAQTKHLSPGWNNFRPSCQIFERVELSGVQWDHLQALLGSTCCKTGLQAGIEADLDPWLQTWVAPGVPKAL
eukprot:2493589-Karenia_brevis.AAC.1